MVLPVTATSSVPTPEISQGGVAWTGSTLPCSKRPTTTKVSTNVSTVPQVHSTSPNASAYLLTITDSSMMAIVIVPKKLPPTGCSNSAFTAAG